MNFYRNHLRLLHRKEQHDHKHNNERSRKILKASIGSYPGSDFNGDGPQGEVTMSFLSHHGDVDIQISMQVTGVTPMCSDANTNPNGCGIHIHEGTTCDDAGAVGGHYWKHNKNFGDVDPWADIRYTSGADGVVVSTDAIIEMLDGNGYNSVKNTGRAVVIHDENGGRIACGILKEGDPSTSAAVELLGAPQFSGSIDDNNKNMFVNVNVVGGLLAAVAIIVAAAIFWSKKKHKKGYETVPEAQQLVV